MRKKERIAKISFTQTTIIKIRAATCEANYELGYIVD